MGLKYWSPDPTVLAYFPNLSYSPTCHLLLTDEALIDLLVGVVDAAAAHDVGPAAAHTLAQLVDEGLVGAAQLHVLLLVLVDHLSGVFSVEVAYPVVVEGGSHRTARLVRIVELVEGGCVRRGRVLFGIMQST